MYESGGFGRLTVRIDVLRDLLALPEDWTVVDIDRSRLPPRRVAEASATGPAELRDPCFEVSFVVTGPEIPNHRTQVADPYESLVEVEADYGSDRVPTPGDRGQTACELVRLKVDGEVVVERAPRGSGTLGY